MAATTFSAAELKMNEGSGRQYRLASASPTEMLLHQDSGKLTPFMVYKATVQGFALKDVESMLSISSLYSGEKVLTRILGISKRTLQRKTASAVPVQLDQQQSAVALQYAKVLEQAIRVFGSQALAEEWLGRPCKHLGGDIPVEVIDNPLGFQAVEDYLERIEYGIYQ